MKASIVFSALVGLAVGALGTPIAERAPSGSKGWLLLFVSQLSPYANADDAQRSLFKCSSGHGTASLLSARTSLVQQVLHISRVINAR